MKWIAAVLALFLMAGHQARAAEPAVIYLSCDGTVIDAVGKSEPIADLGLVINLTEHTVTGFLGIVAHIYAANDVSIWFTGADAGYYQRLLEESLRRGLISRDTVFGETVFFGKLDRATGAVAASRKGPTVEDSYDLVCKVTNRD
jgi:hypothetical protein